MNEINFNISKWKAYWVLMLELIVLHVVLCLYIFYRTMEFRWTESEDIYLLFVLLSLVYQVYKITVNRKRPDLRISAEGLESKQLEEKINLNEIKEFSVVHGFTDSVLVVVLFDPQMYLSKKSYLQRLISKSALKKYGSPVVIELRDFTEKPSEILNKIDQFLVSN